MGRSLMLLALFLATVTAYADRYLFSVVAERVRLEFGLNDLELGLLAGPAMALLFALLGVPVARWADTGHRPRVLLFCLSCWSGFTLLCGFAQSFSQLVVARLGVGMGEAGALPPAHSLVASAFAEDRRAAPAGVLTLATFIGAFLGIAGGGVLVTTLGWRSAFLVFGAAGALIAPLVYVCVREPRPEVRRPRASEMFGPAVIASFKRLLQRRAIFHIVAGYTLYYVFAHTIGAFGVAFMIRSFGLTEAEIGSTWGVVLLTSSVSGTLIAALIMNKLGARSRAWYGLVPAFTSTVAAVFFAIALLSPSKDSVFIFLWCGMAVVALGSPAVYAGVYSQTEEHERALTIALMLLLSNSIGLGLGPVLAGFVSNALRATLGDESLRYTLAAMPVFLILAALAFLRAAAAMGSKREPSYP